MVRRSILAMFAVMAIVLGGVVVSTPAGAVVDSATIVSSPNAGTRYDVLESVSLLGRIQYVVRQMRGFGRISIGEDEDDDPLTDALR